MYWQCNVRSSETHEYHIEKWKVFPISGRGYSTLMSIIGVSRRNTKPVYIFQYELCAQYSHLKSWTKKIRREQLGQFGGLCKPVRIILQSWYCLWWCLAQEDKHLYLGVVQITRTKKLLGFDKNMLWFWKCDKKFYFWIGAEKGEKSALGKHPLRKKLNFLWFLILNFGDFKFLILKTSNRHLSL